MATGEADVEARMGRALTSAEVDRVEGLLEESVVLVQGYLGSAYPAVEPFPSAVRVVESRMVARVLKATNPEGVQSQQGTWGPYQQTTTMAPEASQSGPWLSKADRLMLSQLRPSCVSVPMVSDRYVTPDGAA